MIDVRLQIEEKREPDLKQQAGGVAGVYFTTPGSSLYLVALFLPTLRRPGQLPGGLILTTYVYRYYPPPMLIVHSPLFLPLNHALF
jgi:hypothetical protein